MAMLAPKPQAAAGPGALPTSPRRGGMNTSHIARPPKGDEREAPTELVRPTALAVAKEPRRRAPAAPGGDSAIAEKEECLEQIMSAEANAGFEFMSRYQLNAARVTRVSVDPDQVPLDPLLISELVDGSDLGEPDLEDDEPLPEFEFCVQGGGGCGAPRPLADETGLRLGFGCPSQAEGAGPEQDRVFAARARGYTLLGLVNGHGSQRIGADLASLVAEELPKAVFQSPALQPGGDPSLALQAAFHQVHRAASLALDLSLTGASVTAVLIDREFVFVAHVGDCRCVLAVPDPQPNAEAFHFLPMALTEDHKISAKREFDRVHECGAEMRKLVDDTVYRLFLKDAEIPGLTLTRAVGDRVAHSIGVCHAPSCSAVRRADLVPGCFLILGSGGLWASMSERTAVNWVSRYFEDVGLAAESLAQEGFSRRDAPSGKAKAPPRPDLSDCFSVCIAALDQPEAGSAPQALKPRAFGLQPPQARKPARGAEAPAVGP